MGDNQVSRHHFFNLHDMSQGIRRSLGDGMETRIFPGDQAMLSVVRIEAGCQGKIHSHPEEQWGVLLKGGGVRTQGGEKNEVREGDFWRTPGNVEHSFQAGPEGALVLDIFAPPRAEYRKAGSGYSGAELV